MGIMDAQQISERLNTFFSTDQVNGAVAVYLFGSHAAGRSHRESDVDVADLEPFLKRNRQIKLQALAR